MITAMGDVMRRAHEKGWITTRDGNVSVRRKGTDIMYITPSGTRKTILHPESMLKVRLVPSGYEILSKDAEPSGELSMHGMLQRYHRATRAVVHLHPTSTIAAMFAGWNLQELAGEFPELHRYTRVGPSVPVLPICSDELAIKTFEAMTNKKESGTNMIKFDIIGQAGHGVCAVASNPWDAFEHVERLEHICQIVLASGKKPPNTCNIL